MKLHDIGNTVARGVENVARMGVHVPHRACLSADHAGGASTPRPAPICSILAVTVLTSYDDADLAEAGYSVGVEQLVAERAAQARDIGVDGIVCSAEEAAPLRLIVGPRHAAGDAGHPARRARQRDDQKRVTTPAAAIAAGVDYLVVGRPIVAAPDPKAAAKPSSRRSPRQAAVQRRTSVRETPWRRDY